MPSSLQARSTRRAISPRLAMRIFGDHGSGPYSMTTRASPYSTGRASSNENFRDLARARRRDLVHRLHRLDDEQRLAFLDCRADFDERARAWRCRHIDGADHRRGDDVVRVAGGDERGCRGGGDGRGSCECRSGDRCLHILGRAGAGDADAQIIVFDFDLGQIRVVENVGEVADQRLVDTRFLFSHGGEPCLFLVIGVMFFSACSARM